MCNSWYAEMVLSVLVLVMTRIVGLNATPPSLYA